MDPKTSDRELMMKAFGYKAGFATVNYEWKGQIAASGSGTFQQQIKEKDVVTVGEIPAGLSNISGVLSE